MIYSWIQRLKPFESLFVSNIGSEHFIGFAGAGAISGLGVGAWEQSGAICLILLANIFVPGRFSFYWMALNQNGERIKMQSVDRKP